MTSNAARYSPKNCAEGLSGFFIGGIIYGNFRWQNRDNIDGLCLLLRV